MLMHSTISLINWLWVRTWSRTESARNRWIRHAVKGLMTRTHTGKRTLCAKDHHKRFHDRTISLVPRDLETATRRQLRSCLRGDNYEPDPAETARHATPTAYGNMPALSSSFSALSEGPSSAVAPATVTDVTVGWPLGATPPGLLAPDILGTLKPCLSTTHLPEVVRAEGGARLSSKHLNLPPAESAHRGGRPHQRCFAGPSSSSIG